MNSIGLTYAEFTDIIAWGDELPEEEFDKAGEAITDAIKFATLLGFNEESTKWFAAEFLYNLVKNARGYTHPAERWSALKSHLSYLNHQSREYRINVDTVSRWMKKSVEALLDDLWSDAIYEILCGD